MARTRERLREGGAVLPLIFLFLMGTPQEGGREGAAPVTLLEELLPVPGVSGHEERVREAVRDRLPPWAADVAQVDAHGNLIVEAGDGEPSILFIAHLDEIGFEVKAVAADGSLQVDRKGGFLPTLYEGEIVEIHTGGGTLQGVVPPRRSGEERFHYSSIRVDVGTRTPEETKRLGVGPGDTVTIPKVFDRLLGQRIMGRGMDDRVGTAALLWAVRRVDPSKLPRRTTFAWSTREEIGLLGAKGLAEEQRPAFVFPVDTFVSSDSPRESPRIAQLPLGEGATIRAIDRSNIAPLDQVRRIVRLAKNRGIPVRFGITGGGNDGSVFVPAGAVDLPIAWPLRHSHSAVEICDERDVNALGDLIVALAEEFF